MEDWRIVEVLTPHGFVVAVIYDDGVDVLASFDLGQSPDPATPGAYA